MNIQYKLHEGSQSEKPSTVDTTASATVVYLRKNIERITRIDETTGEEYQLWQYEEAILTHDEFEQYMAENIAEITPYTVTKTAYIDDTEMTFTDVPDGNMSVFIKDSEGNYPSYTVERSGDRVTVSFEALEQITTVTISVL